MKPGDINPPEKAICTICRRTILCVGFLDSEDQFQENLCEECLKKLIAKFKKSARQKEIEHKELCRKMHQWGTGTSPTCKNCGVRLRFQFGPIQTNLNDICPHA